MLDRSRAVMAAAVGLCLAPAAAPAETDRSGYASVNGLEMYYEVHGSGPPLCTVPSWR